jgi:uncharacterized protein YaaN involved in tellurite resistance
MEEKIVDISTTTEVMDLPSLSERVSKNNEVSLSNLTEEQVARCKELTKSVSISDVNSITSYGSDIQSAIGKYSNDFLLSSKDNKTGEIGECINNLLSELDYIDTDDLKITKIKRAMMKLPVIGKMMKTVNKMLTKYEGVSSNIDSISKKIQETRIVALKDNTMMENIFQNNILYREKLEELIVAGKLKLEEIDAQLADMKANRDKYQDYEINDVEKFRERLSKRLTELFTMRYILFQSLLQIRAIQENNIDIADKAQSILTTTLPVWKNQLAISIALYNQKMYADSHKKVSDTTNTILTKNAELLKQNSIEVAKENERTLVDFETLKQTTQSLIETVSEVKKIHIEGNKKREEIEANIMAAESELKETLQVLSGNNTTNKRIG